MKPEAPVKHRCGHNIGRNDRALRIARQVMARKANLTRRYLKLIGYNQILIFTRDENGRIQHA